MQLRDPNLLISIAGLPSKHLKRALSKELNVYAQASSKEGLSCIKQYWDAHYSTVPKLPAIALLNQSSCPRGVSDKDFVALLTRLTDLQQWQIWDLRGTLDVHGCGFVGCPEFTLLVVLMCAALSGQQVPALHACQSTICRVFAGVHVANAVAGLAQCCLLLGLPFGCLCTAIKELQIDLLQLKAQCTQFKQHKACSGSRRGSSCGCHCGSSLCIQSSSWCCPCSSCSCRHLGGVQISWQEPGSNGSKACLCSSKTAAAGSGCNNKTSRSAACNSCSGGSNSNYGSSCCSQVNIQGSSEAETGNAAAAWPNADCQCGQCTRQRADEKDVQLLLYATVRLAQNASLLHRSSSSSSSTPRVIEGLHSNMAAGCCIGCFQHKLG